MVQFKRKIPDGAFAMPAVGKPNQKGKHPVGKVETYVRDHLPRCSLPTRAHAGHHPANAIRQIAYRRPRVPSM